MLSDFLISLISFVLGLGIGQSIELSHERDFMGHEHWRTHLNVKWIRSRWVLALMLVIFVASTIQLVYFSYHQRQCNERFQTAFVVNSVISQEDRALEREDDSLRDRSEEADRVFFRSLITSPPPGVSQQEYVRGIIFAHVEAQDGIKDKREDLDKRRIALEQLRGENPYPDPSC